MLEAMSAGYFTSLSLIMAIGAQGAFILRQGLSRTHVLPMAVFCSASDAVLITVGVFGFGELVLMLPGFKKAIAVVGAAFLFVYGMIRFVAAWRGDYDFSLSGRSQGLGASLAAAAAFTFLNPNVYLDTVGLIGSISTQYSGQDKIAFAASSIAASFTFFFGLGFGARLLSPIMQCPLAWRRLDIIIGLTMWSIALGLLHGVAGE